MPATEGRLQGLVAVPEEVRPLTRLEQKEQYKDLQARAHGKNQVSLFFRELAKKDLFFLLIYVLGITFADNDWVYARCREFEADPDGYLDLWPREHFKSTIITLAAVIQRILVNPNETVGIFSYNRPIAKGFLRVIKWQFESNERLRSLFPDVIWTDPEREAPKWSEDDGIIVKRTDLPKEATVEAWGVIDGMPTSKHYSLCVYDDVETAQSVTSPETIAKVTEMVSISFNLGREGGSRWMLGTIYHYASTYHTLEKRGAVKVRKYGATKDGDFDGDPWLWSKETLAKKIREMGTYVASCQLFNNPVMEGEQTFRAEWVEYWKPARVDATRGMNLYIIVDPSGEKKKGSDYTVMIVLGLAPDNNYYLVDMIRDKLSLSERAERLLALHAQYRPKAVGYEKYGMQADIEYLKIYQSQQNYRFPITVLGGMVPKRDRIRRIQPLFEAHRVYLPEQLIRVGYDGKPHDLVSEFINEEYLAFPYMVHDDMLDCMARIMEDGMEARFPKRMDRDDGLPSYLEAHERDDCYSFDTLAYTGGKR